MRSYLIRGDEWYPFLSKNHRSTFYVAYLFCHRRPKTTRIPFTCVSFLPPPSSNRKSAFYVAYLFCHRPSKYTAYIFKEVCWKECLSLLGIPGGTSLMPKRIIKSRGLILSCFLFRFVCLFFTKRTDSHARPTAAIGGGYTPRAIDEDVALGLQHCQGRCKPLDFAAELPRKGTVSREAVGPLDYTPSGDDDRSVEKHTR